MPSKSGRQHRLMAMAATKPGGYRGIPQKTGRDFIDADRGRHFGGPPKAPLETHHDHAARVAADMHTRLAAGHGPR